MTPKEVDLEQKVHCTYKSDLSTKGISQIYASPLRFLSALPPETHRESMVLREWDISITKLVCPSERETMLFRLSLGITGKEAEHLATTNRSMHPDCL